MSLFNARFEQAAKDLANSDDEVLQSAGMMALMRLETLQRRLKGLNNPLNRKALTPLPYMYPNPPNTFPTPWWQQPTGFSFGTIPQQCFGAPQTSLFGSSNQPSTFGSSQSTAFGSTQSTTFGSSQPAAFGSSQPTTFGSSQPTTFGSQPTPFGSSQPNTFGAGFSQSQNAGTTGSTTSLFGASQSSFGAPAQSTSNSTGNTAFSFGIPTKDGTLDKSEEVAATTEPAVFGTTTSVVTTTFGNDKS